MTKKGKKKRQILEGHKKQGNKFIPPIMQISNIQEVSYLNDGLPNLIWMGLVFERFGYKLGVPLINDFVTTAYKLCDGQNGNFNYLCYYSSLDLNLKAAIYRDLKSQGILYPLQEAISPLSCLFNYFPALFLKPDFKIKQEELLPRLKSVMEQSIDRHSKMATAIQVTALYNLGTNGKLHIAQHISVPNLDSIFNDPDSDEAERAASFARTNVNAELGMMGERVSKGWVRDFWLQIYKLEKCEFMEIS